MTETTKTFDSSRVKSVYSGLPGCCCGCRGKHWADARNIARICKIIAAGDTIYQPGYWVVETKTRVYIAYEAV